MKFVYSLFLFFLLAPEGILLSADSFSLATNGQTEYTIVLPDEPSPVQKTAASELAFYLHQITGAQFPIIEESQVQNTEKLLVIGPSALGAKLLENAGEATDSDLPYDMLAIVPSGNSILFTGHPDRGMLYAVYTFLEDTLGCRWWAPDDEYVPEIPELTLSLEPFRFAPLTRIREPYFQPYRLADSRYAAKMRNNAASISPAYGFCYITHLCHSFYVLFPPELYFLDHPEWYSELDGVRQVGGPWSDFLDSLPKESRWDVTRGATQLCLTNEELIQEFTKKVLNEIKTHPEIRAISVSQEDNNKGGYCHCEKCEAINREEESPSGSLIWFVNRIAEEVEKVYPDIMVETFAYEHTRKPPKHIHARDNVIVRICVIEASYIQTIRDGEQNRDIKEDIEGWGKVAKNLSIWNYGTDFARYLFPFPNWRVLQDNFQYFIENGAIGLTEMGDAHSPGGNFVELHSWLASKLIWDPYANVDQLMNEFLAGFYAPELVPIYREYLDYTTDICEKSGISLGVYRMDANDWIGLEELNQMTRFHQQAAEIAENLAKQDPKRYALLPEKVRLERFSTDFLWLLYGSQFQKEAQAQGKEYLGPNDQKAFAIQFFEEFEKVYGIKYRDNAADWMYPKFKDSVMRRYDNPDGEGKIEY